MGERRGTKGLELWCRRMTEGYPGVNVVNMTTSWRDGLAFCAIIHHFRPDLIDFSKLNKDDIYHNNELAFRVAERHLGIPALLEPEDMVEFTVPDRLSILTYLSQFYQVFGVRQGNSPARISPKRAATSPDHGIVSPASTSPPTKVSLSSSVVVGKVRREPCAKCNLPVFIAERLNVGKLLYHRTCFRCARCNSQLTLANYYETENNEFCCETCPDEDTTADTSSVLTRSLSDEEKSASLKNKQQELDDYSAKFESALERNLANFDKASPGQLQRHNRARSSFMHSLQDDGNFSDEEDLPDLPSSLPPNIQSSNVNDADSGFPSSTYRLETVNNLDDSNSVSNLVSSGDDKLESSHVVTKDAISAEGESNSLVKARMRLFETKSDAHSVKIDENNEVPSTVINSTSANKNENETEHSFENNASEQLSTELNESIITISSEEPNKNQSIIVISDTTQNSNDTNTENLEENSIINTTNEEEMTNEPQLIEKIDLISPSTEKETVNKEEVEECVKDQEAVNVENEEKEYPDDLNPFGNDDEHQPEEKPNKSLNPFGSSSDDDEVAETPPSPKPVVRKKIIPNSDDKRVSIVPIRRISDNPFEEPVPQPRKVIKAPKISLGPFWSDDEEEKPVPKPRTSKSSVAAGAATPEAKPRASGLSITSSTTFGSTTSLSSSQSGGYKKKKLAPRPPMLSGNDSGPNSLTSSPCHSVNQSPRSTPKLRKTKKAPLPPTSTPADSTAVPPLHITLNSEFEKEKIVKDETNRNRQSQTVVSPTSSENSSSLSAPNKSTYGKWKRRKGQAPPRPIPQRRTIKSIPLAEVKRELEIIEIQQQGLEKQGVRLEQIIREKCEGPNSDPDQNLSPEIEDMVLQLFELVNEKNELFRRQAELMYLRRQQRLEEDYADVEYQIRCLMVQPEANKTDSDKAREEELINRLVEIVERRNEIIECLEMDRVREAEEDDSINNQLNLYTMKKEEHKYSDDRPNSSKKDKKKHKKEKQKNKNKNKGIDADKDIDESESPQSTSTVKEKKKKKFNLF